MAPFTLPKDLLGYYSRTFAHYFNGTSGQALSGFLLLPAVDPVLFAVLIDYIKHGSATFPYSFSEVPERDEVGSVAVANRVIHDCVRTLTAFLKLCTAYDVPEAGSAIYEPLSNCISLAQTYSIEDRRFLTDGFVGFVLEVLPDLPGGNPVFALLAQMRFAENLTSRLQFILRGQLEEEVSRGDRRGVEDE